MSKISINLIDRMVTVDGLSYQIPLTEGMMGDPRPAPIRALQFENDRVEVEYGRPLNAVFSGAEAQAYIQPYLDAWAVEHQKELARQAEEALTKPLHPPYEPQPGGGVQEL